MFFPGSLVALMSPVTVLGAGFILLAQSPFGVPTNWLQFGQLTAPLFATFCLVMYVTLWCTVQILNKFVGYSVIIIREAFRDFVAISAMIFVAILGGVFAVWYTSPGGMWITNHYGPWVLPGILVISLLITALIGAVIAIFNLVLIWVTRD
ncbi:MAG: hypothetical protein R3B53_00510 [Candidatus Paceibacterota bacterium]